MSGTDRSHAKKMTRLAQVAGLALVALTAGAVMYNPSLPEAKPVILVPIDDPIEPNGVVTPPMVSFDVDQVAMTFRNIMEIEEPLKKPIEIGHEPDIAPQATPQTDGWAFLGGVFEPSVNFALVSVDGNQMFVQQGQELAQYDVKILSIDPERIEISRAGRRERINRSASTGGQVSVNTEVEKPGGSSVLAPGMQRSAQTQPREFNSRRELGEMDPDIAKRRAEFDRRREERAALQGERER